MKYIPYRRLVSGRATFKASWSQGQLKAALVAGESGRKYENLVKNLMITMLLKGNG
jgi:hypothetical protein